MGIARSQVKPSMILLKIFRGPYITCLIAIMLSQLPLKLVLGSEITTIGVKRSAPSLSTVHFLPNQINCILIGLVS